MISGQRICGEVGKFYYKSKNKAEKQHINELNIYQENEPLTAKLLFRCPSTPSNIIDPI